jgi:hypothetical protein
MDIIMLLKTLCVLKVYKLLLITVRGEMVIDKIDKHDIISITRALSSSTRFLNNVLHNDI